jgi:hypothetical protein
VDGHIAAIQAPENVWHGATLRGPTRIQGPPSSYDCYDKALAMLTSQPGPTCPSRTITRPRFTTVRIPGRWATASTTVLAATNTAWREAIVRQTKGRGSARRDDIKSDPQIVVAPQIAPQANEHRPFQHVGIAVWTPGVADAVRPGTDHDAGARQSYHGRHRTRGRCRRHNGDTSVGECVGHRVHRSRSPIPRQKA